MERRRAFQLPDPPQAHVVIDSRALNTIKDIAHKLWMETKLPNANLLMLEALRLYMDRKGAVANFSVKMEGNN